jgi:mRNA interferase MazF
MAGRRPQTGDLFIVHFPAHRPPGREQEDVRPALVVGIPGVLGQPRYPMMLIAPLTSDHGQPWATMGKAES